jgi:hypothetical protein
MAERVSVGVLWIHLNNYGAAEFSSGRLKGKLFAMADLGSLLFLAALFLAMFSARIAAAIVLTASLLCLPFDLYILRPGPYQRIFKIEYPVPFQRPFVRSNWAALGVLSLAIAASQILHSFSRERAHSKSRKRTD